MRKPPTTRVRSSLYRVPSACLDLVTTKILPVGVVDRVLITLQRGALDILPDFSLKFLGCDASFLSIKAPKASLEGAPTHGMAAPIEFVQ
jgi:hypothetical protein